MGRSGIRFRKPHHHLPKVQGEMSPDDVNRLFGRFRWNAYSPAGALERNGFLMRQVSRLRHDPDHSASHRHAVQMARGGVVVVLALPLVGIVVALSKVL